MSVQRVGIVVHEGRPTAVRAADVVRGWCARQGVGCTAIDVWNQDEQRRDAREEVDAAGDPDLIVTLGGDGTFLRGARLAAQNDALVLGVDLGTLGFLTEVPADDVEHALDVIHHGRAGVETRMMLTMRASRPLELPEGMEALLRYGRGPALPSPLVRPECAVALDWGVALNVTALNDIVLEKLARDRQVSIGVYLSGRLLASYAADAVLVATPTGSTAYSFAAGGPVISPSADAIVFTPVAPHMTFNRSVVAAPDEAVALRVLEGSGRAAVSVDGQLRGVLDPGDWIGVYAAPRRLRVARLEPKDFYGRLRERMRLTDAPAAAGADLAPLWPRTSPVPDDLAHLHLPPLPAGAD
ncbi:NAD(+)/NADH kinase [Streptomyces sp. NPDC048650]|uniref:NAD(+)/NADH kinase n=1 Tax=unclassified Streptomyces TaxID=2593676 RepID=UPI0037119DB0